jgi:UDP-N-acetylmuramate: L-alanyl-gamma-D-glutamyl-meso-diaminopimelate ligase
LLLAKGFLHLIIERSQPMSTEEVFQQILNKQRIVIAGSEGTKLVTSIMRHVLAAYKKPFDIFENGQFHQQAGAALAIITAHETIGNGNPIPDFRKFQHHIGVICNIHHTKGNGFASEDEYIRQYDLFADATPKGGLLAYCEQDPIASVLCNKERPDVAYVPFKTHPHVQEGIKTFLISSNKEKLPITIAGQHALQYVGGAKEVLKKIGISSEQFYQAIVSFAH